MRLFKTAYFHRWAKSEGLKDAALKNAVLELSSGLNDGVLGGGIFKKRIGLGSRGKSGGVRTIVAFQVRKDAFFLYGYAKNDRENISSKEKIAFRELAKIYLGLSQIELDQLVRSGELREVL